MSALYSALKVGNTTILNRIGMSALTRSRSTATVSNEIMLKYYVQRAKGGAGLIVSEGILITRQGTEWPQAPGIWDEAQIEGWKKITDAVHEAGSKIYPTEIADPAVLIAQFKQATINAKEAGVRWVHGANGYIVHQFLDSTSNLRKMPGAEVLRTAHELVAVWGPDVALKISPDVLTGGYNDMGMPLQDTINTYGHLLREVNNMGLSYVTLVRYNVYTDPEIDGKKRATQHDVVEAFTPFLTDIPVFINSGVTPLEAEELVKNGKAAGVFMGMNWITHPDLGRRIKAGKQLDNAPNFTLLYGAEGVDPALGYTDYKLLLDTIYFILPHAFQELLSIGNARKSDRLGDSYAHNL
ncbi:hypothetical protein K438DRAFT_1914537 [Mycena galopus ATCC 62051]|nr:hypothetical protein K438DRAFT_1914537 [Mycena galopus ATCC 62051]